MLFGLMRARLERSVEMAAAQHAAAPDNDYLLISQRGRDASCSHGWRARTRTSRTSASATRAGTRRRRRRGASASSSRRTTCAPVMDGDWAAAPGARPGRGDAAGRRPRDRPLRRGARDLHRARVPDAGRALADAAHGRRPVRPRGDAGLRAAGRRRRGAREPRPAAATTAGCWCCATGTSGRCTGISIRRRWPRARCARARRSRGWARRRSTAAGSRTCTCSSSPTWCATCPGVALSDEADVWRSVCPDPNLLLGLPGGVAARPPRPDIAARRPVVMSQALSLAYRSPLHIVRGRGAYLYDADGREYLDLVNNVAHVGHCHPRVVAAGARQMAELNTNTRYLHGSVIDYARRLAATLPGPAARVLLRELGLGGQRPRVAAGRGAHGPRGRDRARPRLSRASALDDRAEPVQVPARRRADARSPRCRPSRGRWSRCRR